MLEIEKKRAEVIDSKMNVTINLETGETSLKIDEADNEFSFAAQNKAVNQFMQDQLSSEARDKGGLFKPFEVEGKGGKALSAVNIEQVAARMADLGSFNIKAANLNDTKS